MSNAEYKLTSSDVREILDSLTLTECASAIAIAVAALVLLIPCVLLVISIVIVVMIVIACIVGGIWLALGLCSPILLIVALVCVLFKKRG